MISKKLQGNLILLLTALIWGTTFVAQDIASKYIGPFTVQAARGFIGELIILPILLICDAKNKKAIDYTPPTRAQIKNELVIGGLCGLAFFFSSGFQQYAITLGAGTGKAGFLSVMYVVLVPVFGIFMKKKTQPHVWVCVAVAAAGLYFLCMKGGAFRPEASDIFLLLGAASATFQILIIDSSNGKIDPMHLSCIQLAVCGGLAFILSVTVEKPSAADLVSALPSCLFMGLMSSGIAYTLQIIGQKMTTPTMASIILGLEALFAAVSGAILLNQRLSTPELIGCGLMLIATIFSQITFKYPEKVKKE